MRTTILFFVLLLIIPEFGWGESTVNSTSQTVSSTSNTLTSGTAQGAYPPMYILSKCGPEFFKLQETFTYKTNIQPTMMGSNLRIIWGNGRFRMIGDYFEVQDPEHLPEKHHFPRQQGFGFEDKLIVRPDMQFISSERVAGEVERIRYINGFVYTMGSKDAFTVVNIQKETWEAYPTVEEAPSPHKEELIKLKGSDKDNLIWTGNTKEPRFRWVPESELK